MNNQKVATVVFIIAMLYIFFRTQNKSPSQKFDHFPVPTVSKPEERAEPFAPARAVASSQSSRTEGRSPKASPSQNSSVDLEKTRQAKDALVEQYDSGNLLTLPSGRVRILTLKALPRANQNSSAGTPIAERFGMAIYPAKANDGFFLSNGGRPVVAKHSNGLMGIVTGTLIIRLKDPDDYEKIGVHHFLNSIYFDPKLNLGFYSAPQSTLLDQLVEELKNDPSVESVELEILYSKKRA